MTDGRYSKCYIHYFKASQQHWTKLRAFLYSPVPVDQLNSSLNLSQFPEVEEREEEVKQKILSFVFLRNLLKIQNFSRAVLKTKNEAALRIQRHVK